ncbi:hypothetical protein [Emticicia oligotrophica]|uniref:hypothetical protein n=1 Tax=Emticicia oligotrophica TaxID=312279 RepID=UPI00273C0D75|nr:hypothetical protein [Emticicia oligotrophica]
MTKLSKKVKIFFLIIVTALSIWHYYSGIFCRYTTFTALYNISLNKFKIVYYGEQDELDKYYELAALKYGIKYQRIAGSNISTPLRNGAENYNKTMRQWLSNDLEIAWEFDFCRETENIYFQKTGKQIDKKCRFFFDNLK